MSNFDLVLKAFWLTIQLLVLSGIASLVFGTLLGMGLGYLMGVGLLAVMGSIMQQYVHLELGGPVIQPGLVVMTVVLGIGVTPLVVVCQAKRTPVARRAPEVDVQDHVAARRQQVVEHVLAVVGGPPLVHVLEVAGAVHEDDGGAVGLGAQLPRPVDAGGHAGAVAGLEAHDLGDDPREAPPRLGR